MNKIGKVHFTNVTNFKIGSTRILLYKIKLNSLLQITFGLFTIHTSFYIFCFFFIVLLVNCVIHLDSLTSLFSNIFKYLLLIIKEFDIFFHWVYTNSSTSTFYTFSSWFFTLSRWLSSWFIKDKIFNYLSPLLFN